MGKRSKFVFKDSSVSIWDPFSELIFNYMVIREYVLLIQMEQCDESEFPSATPSEPDSSSEAAGVISALKIHLEHTLCVHVHVCTRAGLWDVALRICMCVFCLVNCFFPSTTFPGDLQPHSVLFSWYAFLSFENVSGSGFPPTAFRFSSRAGVKSRPLHASLEVVSLMEDCRGMWLA